MFFGKQFIIGTSLLVMHAFQPGQSQFSADLAVGTGPGTQMGAPFSANTVAPPAENLRRQAFTPQRIFTRTCDCVRRFDSDLVRPFSSFHSDYSSC